MQFGAGELAAICEFMFAPHRELMIRIEPSAIDHANSPLKGQVCLVTGGGTGLGRAYARAMAKHGMRVAIASRNMNNLEETARLIRQDGGEVLALTVDVTDASSVHHMVEKVESELGPIDLLVNNAGIGGPIESWMKVINEGGYEETMRVNYEGAFLCTGMVCEHMHNLNRGGRIINIASSTVESRPEFLGIYAISKWQVVEMTKNVAHGLGEAGIKIFAVHPGTVKSPMIDAMLVPENKGKLPLLEHIFSAHKDVSEDVAVELILHVASGAVDHLSGKFLCRKEGTVVQCQE
jgi:NAD(P)-dependent dehydrogenase (short-subunit alcohol dehydrogenase family)